MKPDKIGVGERLKLIRKDLGWTIEMMAKHVGLTKGTFNSYLRGLALPPESIIEKVSQLSGVSEEWIYYGDIKNFIKDYLISQGYEEFLKDFPNTIDKIYLEYEIQKNKYSLNESYPHEITINDLFYDIYHPIFKEHIENIASIFAINIQKYPLYSGGPEYNSEKYLSRVRNLIHRERPSIKYGEVERIFKIAETEYITRVDLYMNQIDKIETKSNDFLDFMIEKLKTTRGVLDIISIITSQNGLKNYDISSKEFEEVIGIFKEMHPKFIKVKESYLNK